MRTSRHSTNTAIVAVSATVLSATIITVAVVAGSALGQDGAQPIIEELLPPEAFDDIADRDERAAAIFDEAGKVFTHARCLNCHVDGDRPRQGDDQRLHQPWVRRGSAGFGVPGLRCMTCHNEENFEPAAVPGAPNWHLAPRSMAWESKSIADICQQIKDPERNGERSLQDLVEHVINDPLVTWGWNPGPKRVPAPGSQEVFAALIQAWVDDGAACPPAP